MRLPKKPNSFDDLFDRIIVSEDPFNGSNDPDINTGNMFSNAWNQFIKTGTQYAKQDLQAAGLYNPNSAKIKQSIESVDQKCKDSLVVNKIDLISSFMTFKSVFYDAPYTNSNGSIVNPNINSYFKNKPLVTNLNKTSKTNIPLYFNIKDWISKSNISQFSLASDSSYTNLISKNKDVLDIIKRTIGLKDYSGLAVLTNMDNFTKIHLLNFIDSLLDKNTKKTSDGLTSIKIQEAFLSYLHCILSQKISIPEKSTMNYPNLNEKFFWLFCMSKKNMLID